VTYEYQCTDPACHHEWEAEQKITAAPLRTCPKCAKATAKRLISKSAFVLNGEGWFKSGGY
jgi:putative FmdB family regulatory protein